MGAISGHASIAAEVIRTVPRELGRRLQGLTVMAGKRCSGVPKRSSDSGWMCHCTLARSCAGSDRVIMQSCDAAMVIGERPEGRVTLLGNHELATLHGDVGGFFAELRVRMAAT